MGANDFRNQKLILTVAATNRIKYCFISDRHDVVNHDFKMQNENDFVKHTVRLLACIFPIQNFLEILFVCPNDK